ncbi:MAG: hypothetical protein R3A45_11750 [Bdellovibrionota bacterium]
MVFNQNEVSQRWKSLTKEYWEYQHQNNHLLLFALKVKNVWNRIKELLSFVTTLESFKYIKDTKSMHKNRPQLVDHSISSLCEKNNLFSYISTKNRGAYLREYDGHFETCSFFVPDQEKINNIATSYLTRNSHQMANWQEIDKTTLNRLESAIEKLLTYTEQLIIVRPPYHPKTYQLLIDNNETAIKLMHLEKFFTEMTKKDQCYFLDLQNPKIAGCDETMFDDSHHGNQSCVRQVAEKIHAIIHSG